MLLTYGTAYRAVVERLNIQPGQSMLVMGGGKGTSYAGAQIAKAMGARVILVGSNQALADDLIERGIADAFVNRRLVPPEVYGVVAHDEEREVWWERTEPFRRSVYEANDGRPVDAVFEHTGGENFPLLASVLADGGAFGRFGATGRGSRENTRRRSSSVIDVRCSTPGGCGCARSRSCSAVPRRSGCWPRSGCFPVVGV